MEILKEALRIAKEVGDFRFAGDVAVTIAIALMQEKRFSLAKRVLSMARNFYVQDPQPGALDHSRIRLLEAEAMWAWKQRRKGRARALLHRAREYAVKSEQAPLLFRVDMALSKLLEELDKPEASLDYAREGYNAVTAGGYHRDRALGLLRLYELYRLLRRWKDAYLALEAALIVAQKLHDVHLIDRVLKEREAYAKIYQPEDEKEKKAKQEKQPPRAAVGN